MQKHLRRIAIFSALCLASTHAIANEIPMSLLSSVKGNHAVAINKVTDIVKQNISLSPTSGNSKAEVQMIFDSKNKPDYLLVYLLSAKNYSFTITKIKVDENYHVTSVTPDYHLQKNDYAQQPKVATPSCPDDSVELVSATPVDTYPTAKDAVDHVYQQAGEKGYVAKELLGDEASVESYMNWLSCPNLKAFYNVGHGSSDGIMLSDGVLSHDNFTGELNKKLGERAVVLFNSCEVENDPLKSSITEDADAQKYAGGISNLVIGPSEAASKCFWDAALDQQPMTANLADCNQKYDSGDQFGIDGHGADLLNLA